MPRIRNLRSLVAAAMLAATAFAVVSAQSPRAEAKRAIRLETKMIQSRTPAGSLTGPTTGDPLQIARRYLTARHQDLGLAGADLEGMVVSSHLTGEHNGVTNVYFAQRYEGIEIYSAVANVNVARDGSVLSAGTSFTSNVAQSVNSRAPGRDAVEAVEAAARHLGLTPPAALSVREVRGGATQEVVVDETGLARSPIVVKLIYVPVAERDLRLSWLVDIDALGGDDWWQVLVDAVTGEVLGKDSLTVHDDWGPAPMLMTDEPGSVPVPLTRVPGLAATPALASRPAYASSSSGGDVEALSGGSPNNVPGTGSYRVFAMPLESPNDGPRTLVVDPADAVASPFGWHDTNGAPGPEFTRTRGNNVHAYTDIDANNVADPGSDPDGGADLYFDFPLDLGLAPASYRPATVANLFYWNNLVHDVFYRYGFTELAGNFQVNNYGRGPTVAPLGANDDVRAEAQDGSGTNNANFSTPSDGSRPRMQMFVWTYPFVNALVVHAPGAIAGRYPATNAAFGPQLSATGPRTADVVIGLDEVTAGGPSTTDACTPLVNAAAVSGRIALVDRGSCPFVDKVANAQAAGAIAVIVANNVAGAPGTLGGTSAAITIPSVMISLDDGTLLKANMPVNATLEAESAAPPHRDSDLDAGVIAHEHGHGISNRLTGGRTTVGCLGNQEQMGEGWSDWVGLVLTTRSDHYATQRRGIGTYLLFQSPNGNGIRPAPYSTDMAINPATYDTIKTAAVPHGVGYVWASMLWENYWDLVEKHGFNPDPYGHWSTGGNNLAMQLVVDGMKLQPCSPGFVTGRNAILQADRALTGGENQCTLWKGFAKRGLGLSASQGLSNSVADGTQAFDQPLGCAFDGFFAPIAAAPAVNSQRAGSSIPVKWSLGGDFGLDYIIDGVPVSRRVACDTGAPADGFAPIETPGKSVLTYDADADQYIIVWKTPRTWAGQCRELRVHFANDVWHKAYFRFF